MKAHRKAGYSKSHPKHLQDSRLATGKLEDYITFKKPPTRQQYSDHERLWRRMSLRCWHSNNIDGGLCCVVCVLCLPEERACDCYHDGTPPLW